MHFKQINKTKKFIFLSLFVILTLFLPACNGSMDTNMGVTPGGSQDNAYARELIDNGIVPRADLFTYEGAFSEHDFFTNTESSCDELICMNTILTKFHSAKDDKDRYMAQLILSSNIDMEEFSYEQIDLYVVLDKSGSMFGDKFEASKTAINTIIKKLKPEDRLGILAFDEGIEVIHELQVLGEDTGRVIEKVKQLSTGGSTNIEFALEAAYQGLLKNEDNKNKRILLITDAKPNVDATNAESFLSIIKNYENKIGLTVFGLGIDFGAELTKALSETKGANYIYLNSSSEMKEKLSDQFELLISPIAHNFQLTLTPSQSFEYISSYGLPENSTQSITLNAKTLFLSKSKGAIAIEFEYKGSAPDQIVPMNNEKLFTYQWSYEDLEGSAYEKNESLYFSPFTTTSGQYEYSLAGSQKLPLLVNMISSLKQASNLYFDGNDDEALSIVKRLLTDLETANEVLKDAQIQEEIYMVRKLEAILAKEI